MSISDLPNEVFASILRHLNWSDRLSVMRVSRLCREIVLSSSVVGKIRITLGNANEMMAFFRILSLSTEIKILQIFGGVKLSQNGHFNLSNSFQWWKDEHKLGMEKYSFMSRWEHFWSRRFIAQTGLQCLLIESSQFNFLQIPKTLRHLQVNMLLDGTVYLLGHIILKCEGLEFLNLSAANIHMVPLCPFVESVFNETFMNSVKLINKKLKVLLLTRVYPSYDALPLFFGCLELEFLGFEISWRKTFTPEFNKYSPLFQYLTKLKLLKVLLWKFKPWNYEMFMLAINDLKGVILLPKLRHLSLSCSGLEPVELINIIDMISVQAPDLRSITLSDCNLIADNDTLSRLISSLTKFTNLKRFGMDSLEGIGRHNLLMFIEKLDDLAQKRSFESVCMCVFTHLDYYKKQVCIKKDDQPRIISYIKDNFVCTFCEPKYMWKLTCDCCKIPGEVSITDFLNI